MPSGETRRADVAQGAAPALNAAEITRAVVASQTVFTIGHVLTTGGFLYYFANALHPTALMFAVLLVTPEISETFAVCTRSIIGRLGSRKRTWLVTFLLARLAALGIPAIALGRWGELEQVAFWCLVGSLAAAHLFQSVAYTAYISWLSDLVPSSSWGAFFALRRMAHVAVMVGLPALALVLRQNWSDWLSNDGVRRAYFGVFLLGNGCLWLSMWPLLRLPDLPVDWQPMPPGRLRPALESLIRDRSLRGQIVSAWWLAAAQGLTQAAFFSYQVRVLHLPLHSYLALSGWMYVLQLGWVGLGGWISDRFGDKWPLLLGLLAVSCALGFWLLARPGATCWLLAAYGVWGLFGVVNVCQRNLLLRCVPRSDNSLPIAVIEQGAGMLAGLAGLVGGWWLDRLIAAGDSASAVAPYQTLFVISWIGRATAALWLLPVREPRRSAE